MNKPSLLDPKVNGRYPKRYVPAAETDLRKTFDRIRREQKAQPSNVHTLTPGKCLLRKVGA